MSFTVIKTNSPLDEQFYPKLNRISDDWLTVAAVDCYYVCIYTKLSDAQITYLTMLLGGNIHT